MTRVGSSAQHMRVNEKMTSRSGDADEDDEVKSIDRTHVTNEPEEIMDFRERIYEQNIRNDVLEDNGSESVPLLPSEGGMEYGSSGKTNKVSEDEPSGAAKGESATSKTQVEPEMVIPEVLMKSVEGTQLEGEQSTPAQAESNEVPPAELHTAGAPQIEQASSNETSPDPSSRDVTPGAEGSSSNQQSKNKSNSKKKKKSGKKGSKKKKRK